MELLGDHGNLQSGCGRQLQMYVSGRGWGTHSGWFDHQYLTRNTPMFFKRAGEAQWHWLNMKTYKEIEPCPKEASCRTQEE